MTTEDLYRTVKDDEFCGGPFYEATINSDCKAVNERKFFAKEIAWYRKGDRVIIMKVGRIWAVVIAVVRRGEFRTAGPAYAPRSDNLRMWRFTDIRPRVKKVRFEGIDKFINPKRGDSE